MALFRTIFSGNVTYGTQASGVVLAGPFRIENGFFYMRMHATTGAAAPTVPTAVTMQVANDAAGTNWFTTTTTLTASTSINTTTSTVASAQTGSWVRFISGGAFGSNTATLSVLIAEAS